MNRWKLDKSLYMKDVAIIDVHTIFRTDVRCIWCKDILFAAILIN